MLSPKTKLLAILICLLFLMPGVRASASTSDGTILSGYTYAWSNNSGWVNFGLASGNVHVLANQLTGYAWSANHGWINLAPTNGGVTNDGGGTLGGWAWGEGLGWVSFTGVTIDSSGRFHGQATGNVAGTITFDCGYCDVRTDWRPTSTSSGGPVPPQPPAATSTPPDATSTPPATTTPPVEPLPLTPPTQNTTVTGQGTISGNPGGGVSSGGGASGATSNTAAPADAPSGSGIPGANLPPGRFLTYCELNPEGPQCGDYCASHPNDHRCPLKNPSTFAAITRSAQNIQKNLADNLVTPETTVVTGAAALLAAPAIAVAQYSALGLSVASLSELWLILLQLFRSVLAIFGLRRRRPHWGTVYDAVTKQPLDPVIVELVEAKTGKRVEQAITDLQGRFGFMAQEGTFRLTAKKSHYRFPAEQVSGPADEVYSNLYYGEPITLTGTDIVVPNIPMDPLEFDWNQAYKRKFIKFHPFRELVSYILQTGLFYLGLSWTLLTVVLSPSWFSILCLAVYLVVLLVRWQLPARRMWGRIYDTKTGLVPTNAVLELLLPDSTVIMGRARSGSDGRFFLKAQPGTYRLLAYQMSPPGNMMTLLGQRSVSVGRSGVLNANVGLPMSTARGVSPPMLSHS